MILMINKWHKVDGKEVSSTVKVEKQTEVEAYKEAKRQEYQLAANYMGDASVTDWAVSIVDPKSCRIVEHLQYFSPAPVVEEEQFEPNA